MRRFIRASAGAFVLCGALFVADAAKAQSWPEFAAPDGAQVREVGRDIVLNGMPARLIEFDVAADAAEVLGFYRRRFGARRVENRVNGAQVVAARQGDYFFTVQIKPAGTGASRGTLMIARLRGGGGRSAVALDTEKLMPSDAAVLTRMQSDDAGKRSVMVLAAHAGSVLTLRDHIVHALQERGFRVAKEDAGWADGRASMSLALASPTEEVMVTIVDAGRYRSVLINRTREAP